MKQTSFLKDLGYKNSKTSFGGAEHEVKKTRKIARPLDSHKPLHLILKSSKAKNGLSFKTPEHFLFIDLLIKEKSKKFGIRIESYANVGNHIHFNLRFSNRKNFQNFLRAITSLIARKITGARKGVVFGKFWDYLAYTSVVTSKLYLFRLSNYITANQIESKYGKKHRELFLAFDALRPRAPI